MKINSHIVCIGEILWDSFPGKGLFLGGAPFNVACHLHMLQEKSIMISRIGEDQLGKEILRNTEDSGVITDFIQKDQQYPTGLVNVTLHQADNPSYDIVEPAAWDFIEYNEELFEKSRNSKAIIFGSLAQRNAVSRNTIELLRKNSRLSVFDVNLRPPYDNQQIVKNSLDDAHIVKLNEEELTRLAEWFSLKPGLKETAIDLADQFDCQSVCVTRGAKGAALWHRGIWTEHVGFKIDIKDTVGSGDAFLAALLTGVLSEKENDEILEFANAVGAFVASKDGATPVLEMDEVKLIAAEY